MPQHQSPLKLRCDGLKYYMGDAWVDGQKNGQIANKDKVRSRTGYEGPAPYALLVLPIGLLHFTTRVISGEEYSA